MDVPGTGMHCWADAMARSTNSPIATATTAIAILNFIRSHSLVEDMEPLAARE
jgi:hypothetical protein